MRSWRAIVCSSVRVTLRTLRNSTWVSFTWRGTRGTDRWRRRCRGRSRRCKGGRGGAKGGVGGAKGGGGAEGGAVEGGEGSHQPGGIAGRGSGRRAEGVDAGVLLHAAPPVVEEQQHVSPQPGAQEVPGHRPRQTALRTVADHTLLWRSGVNGLAVLELSANLEPQATPPSRFITVLLKRYVGMQCAGHFCTMVTIVTCKLCSRTPL